MRRRKRMLEGLDQEIREHIDRETQDNIARGMPPQEARYAAVRKFGNVTRVREETREVWSFPRFEELLLDIRYGLRVLRISPGFTCVAILTLALGIGANTAIYTLIDAVMLRMLPVKNPQELVSLNLAGPLDTQFPRDVDGDFSTEFPYPAFAQMREHNQVLSALFAFKDTGRLSVLVNGNAEIVHGQLVTSNYFSALGVRAVLGRDFAPEEDAAGADSVAIISYGYWQSHFGGEASVLGRQILVNGAPVTIVGVAAPEFFGLQAGSAVDLYMTMTMQPQIMPHVADDPRTSAFAATGVWWIQLMGRLKPGVTPEQARANLDVIYRPAVLQGLRPEAGSGPLIPPALELVPAGGGLSGLRNTFSKPLAILMIVVGIVLLIACVNVANLLLVRSSARAKEIAVRLSLGASRGRLIRQLLLESVLLSAFGGLLGLVFAYWGCNALVAMMQHANNPLSIDVHPDLNVLAFTAVACVVTGILFGLTPALRATRVELTPALKQTAATLGTTRHKIYTTKTLVVAQVAVSVVLLFCAGLFVRTLVNLETMNVGFSRDNLLLFGVSLKNGGYTGRRYADLCREIQSRVAQLPGVKSATSSLILLLSGNMWLGSIKVPGYSARPNENTSVSVLPVGDGFLSTLGIPLLHGRDLSPRDDESAPKVALVNETLARKYWPSENPLGRPFTLRNVDMEVVGIVADAKYTSLRRDIPPTVYYPYVQQMDSMPQMHFEMRTAGDASTLISSVRQVVASIDNRLPLFDVRTQTQQIDDLLYQERLFAKLVGFFATLALALVCVGLYGVMSYSVARRTSEIGIRMALGANRGNVLNMVLRGAFWQVGIGLCIGTPLAILCGRYLAHQLYGVGRFDPLVLAGATLVLVVCALLAGFLPALRAASIEPVEALRSE
jgi:predicted permease